MTFIYKPSEKELFEIRNNIFLKDGIIGLAQNNFVKSPLKSMRYGKLEAGIFAYDLCRIGKDSNLEIITVYIVKGDRWIKISLNIFQLTPVVKNIEELSGSDQLQFFLPPNSKTSMALRLDDFEGIPLFRTKEYKIKSFYTKSGFMDRVNQLRDLIRDDMTNIDIFINNWHRIYKPMVTTWDGIQLTK